MYYTKITPARVCPSIHLSIQASIHLSVRLLCPSKPNAKDDASSSGGPPAVSRGLSFVAHAVPCSFARSLATAVTRSSVAKRATRADSRFCNDQRHLRGVARAAPREYTHAKSIDPQRPCRLYEISRPGSLTRRRSVCCSLFISYAARRMNSRFALCVTCVRFPAAGERGPLL